MKSMPELMAEEHPVDNREAIAQIEPIAINTETLTVENPIPIEDTVDDPKDFGKEDESPETSSRKPLDWKILGKPPLVPVHAKGEPILKLDMVQEPLPAFGFIGSFTDHLWSQVSSSEFKNNQDFKSERIRNFLTVPIELEKFVFVGYFICLDSFLFNFAILPIRIFLALGALAWAILSRNWSNFKASHKTDLLKGLLISVCFAGLQFVDASRLYHSVRGQSVIKLYVIFGVLEICDKLCSAFGHDILDSLFSIQSSNHESLSKRQISRLTHFVVASIYIFAHTIVLFYQVVTLNVAINSYNNALLTLLLSNQFSELKTSVFKRFERENLFQLSCSDVVERFQLSVFLLIINIRNYSEIIGGTFEIGSWMPLFDFTMLWLRTWGYVFQLLFQYLVAAVIDRGEAETKWMPNILGSAEYRLAETLVTPVLIVFGAEILVDWLKHAFITKFNLIPPIMYQKFRNSLCRDLLGNIAKAPDSPVRNQTPNNLIDRGPVVAKRIGFVSIPLACLILRVFFQIFQSSDESIPLADVSQEEDPVLVQHLKIPLPYWIKKEHLTQSVQSWLFFLSAVVSTYLLLLLFKVLLSMALRAYSIWILDAETEETNEDAPAFGEWTFERSRPSSAMEPLMSEKVTPDGSPKYKFLTHRHQLSNPDVMLNSPEVSHPYQDSLFKGSPLGSSHKIDEKIDRVDRFTMVKSRII